MKHINWMITRNTHDDKRLLMQSFDLNVLGKVNHVITRYDWDRSKQNTTRSWVYLTVNIVEDTFIFPLYFIGNIPNKIVSTARRWDYYLSPGISCNGILLLRTYPWISCIIFREWLSYYTKIELGCNDQSKVGFHKYQDHIVQYEICNYSNFQICESVSWSCKLCWRHSWYFGYKAHSTIIKYIKRTA